MLSSFAIALTSSVHGHDHGHEAGSSIWAEYVTLMRDPAHLLVELTFTFLSILLVELGFRVWKARFVRRLRQKFEDEHHRLDEEHGVTHMDASSAS